MFLVFTQLLLACLHACLLACLLACFLACLLACLLVTRQQQHLHVYIARE